MLSFYVAVVLTTKLFAIRFKWTESSKWNYVNVRYKTTCTFYSYLLVILYLFATQQQQSKLTVTLQTPQLQMKRAIAICDEEDLIASESCIRVRGVLYVDRLVAGASHKWAAAICRVWRPLESPCAANPSIHTYKIKLQEIINGSSWRGHFRVFKLCRWRHNGNGTRWIHSTYVDPISFAYSLLSINKTN